MGLRKIVGILVATCLLAVVTFALDLPANKVVDAKWLKANMGNKELVIIDIRDKNDLYTKAHIPGAIYWSTDDFRETRFNDVIGYLPAPLSMTRLMKKSGITKDSKVVFYSDGTKDSSYTIAALGVYVTEYYGFKNTAILNGGIASWEKEGYPVDDKLVNPVKSDWKITNIDTDIYASIADVDKAVELHSAQMLDTRPNAQVDGSEKHPKVLAPGHIPGAKHLYVGNFTKDDSKIFYLDPASAKAQFAKAKLDPTKPVIWYCNTSWFASGAWFAAKYLGGLQNAKVYDGSMVEYTRTPKRKLEMGAIR